MMILHIFVMIQVSKGTSMPNIQKIELTSKMIKSLQAHTTNAEEMNPETQKIVPLWKNFHTEIMSSLKEGTPLYAVYHNYASGADGVFDVLVGSEEEGEGLVSVTLQEGRYLKFSVKGEMPQAAIDAWIQVWAYFEDPSIDERRAYETDFELYKSTKEAEIYIGVHYF